MFSHYFASQCPKVLPPIRFIQYFFSSATYVPAVLSEIVSLSAISFCLIDGLSMISFNVSMISFRQSFGKCHEVPNLLPDGMFFEIAVFVIGSFECYGDKMIIGSPCRRFDIPVGAGIDYTLVAGSPSFDIGSTVKNICNELIVWVVVVWLGDVFGSEWRCEPSRVGYLNAIVINGQINGLVISFPLAVAQTVQDSFAQSLCRNFQPLIANDTDNLAMHAKVFA